MNNKSQLESVIGELRGQNSKDLEAQRAAIDKQIVDMIAKQTAMSVEEIVKGLSKRKKTVKEIPNNTANKIGNVNANFYADAVSASAPKLRTGDSAANIGAKIYAVMKQDNDERKLRSELSKNREDEQFDEEKRRQEELIAAVNKSKAGLKAKKSKWEPQPRDEKGRFIKKEPAPAEAKAPAPKPAEAKAPAPKPAEAPAPKTTTATKSAPEAPAAPSAVKPVTPATTGGVSTAAKVAIGAVGVVAASQAIGGAESGGNYDITYGDRVDSKTKKIVNPKYKTTQDLFGKNLTDMTLNEVQQFGKIRSENGQGAGAVGKYQFMPSVLFGRTGKDGKHIAGLVEQLNLPMTSKFDAATQDKLQDLLHTQNITTLKKLGVPITPGYEYMAHYIGAAGAKAIFDSVQAGENKVVAQVMMDHNYPVGNNKELYEIRAKDFESILQSRLQKKGGLVTPHSSGTDIGTKLNESSKQNSDLKGGNKGTNVAIDNTKTTVMSSGGSTPQTIRTPTPSERPAIIGG